MWFSICIKIFTSTGEYPTALWATIFGDLSRSMNSLCRSSLKESLSRTVNLSKLVLTSKCSNDILETLGKNCFKLKDLYISLSEMVMDVGIEWLVPKGCPQLVTLDLIKCWNVSPSGARLLLLELKKLRKLLYRNMKSVMELPLQSEETGGSFCFEYFYSSEYDLVNSSELLNSTGLFLGLGSGSK